MECNKRSRVEEESTFVSIISIDAIVSFASTVPIESTVTLSATAHTVLATTKATVTVAALMSTPAASILAITLVFASGSRTEAGTSCGAAVMKPVTARQTANNST